jgi:hypothetical protein
MEPSARLVEECMSDPTTVVHSDLDSGAHRFSSARAFRFKT